MRQEKRWNEKAKEKVREKQDKCTLVVGGETEEDKAINKARCTIAKKEEKKLS